MGKTGIVQLDIRNFFNNIDCILAYETAADYLGSCSMCSERPYYYVYSEEDLNINGVLCIIVDSLNDIPFITRGNIKCTTLEKTLVDLLANDRDDEIICQSLSYWYETHNQSFDDLNIPENLKSIFDDYKEDAINYYND